MDSDLSPRPAKRRREPNNPEGQLIASSSINWDVSEPEPQQNGPPDLTDRLLDRATHVLAIEAAALSNISRHYRTDLGTRKSLEKAVEAIVQANAAGGKLVACGVGKSAYIAQKLVATCKSLGIGASFLHACEALHGDLGDIRLNDVLLLVSYSAKTPELLNLLVHISEGTRVICLSGNSAAADCRLLQGREDGILLPAFIPEKEEHSFGVAAPTTSTTVALAVADMLALTAAGELHRSKTGEVFKRNHPGGAIGMTHSEVEKLKQDGETLTVVELPSPSISATDEG